MALTFEDMRDKIIAGLGGLIVAGILYLISSTMGIKADVAYLKTRMDYMPDRKEISEIAASQGKDSYQYDRERINEKITDIQQALQNLSQYQREVQIKGFDDIRLMQIELKQLTTQFQMWRTIEEKRIRDSGGYDPNNKTYNAEETHPPDLLHKPTPPKE